MTTKCGGTCCGGDHKCTCEVSEFKREPRYVVFKLKDIKKYLHPMDQQILMELGNRIAKGRREDVKPPFNAVVVEQDWPEFDLVWSMIEARMAGMQQVLLLPPIADRFRELERQRDEMQKDAERYRHLKENSLGPRPAYCVTVNIGHDWSQVSEIDELDSVLDADLAKGQS